MQAKKKRICPSSATSASRFFPFHSSLSPQPWQRRRKMKGGRAYFSVPKTHSDLSIFGTTNKMFHSSLLPTNMQVPCINQTRCELAARFGRWNRERHKELHNLAAHGHGNKSHFSNPIKLNWSGNILNADSNALLITHRNTLSPHSCTTIFLFLSNWCRLSKSWQRFLSLKMCKICLAQTRSSVTVPSTSSSTTVRLWSAVLL